MTLYADDPDVHVEYEIKDATGGDNDFVAQVRVAGAPDVTGAWQGSPGPVRILRVSLAGLAAGPHDLRLIVPGGNDVPLGRVWLR